MRPSMTATGSAIASRRGARSYASLLPAALSTPEVVTPGGYSEGWNASLTFSIEGVALAA